MNLKPRDRQATCSQAYQWLVTDDGSRTLFSIEDQESFHSESGAVSESRLVFLENSGIAQRLEKASARVIEIGYGTGLNFLLTAEKAILLGSRLDYLAVDPTILNANLLGDLKYEALLSETLAATHREWLAWHGALAMRPGESSQLHLGELAQLSLHCADATVFNFAEFGPVNAVYLDAFSPQTSPQLWSGDFLSRLADCLLEGGCLVTYCVKSEIQNRLRELGFAVEKTRGPHNGKREVLIARKIG